MHPAALVHLDDELSDGARRRAPPATKGRHNRRQAAARQRASWSLAVRAPQAPRTRGRGLWTAPGARGEAAAHEQAGTAGGGARGGNGSCKGGQKGAHRGRARAGCEWRRRQAREVRAGRGARLLIVRRGVDDERPRRAEAIHQGQRRSSCLSQATEKQSCEPRF